MENSTIIDGNSENKYWDILRAFKDWDIKRFKLTCDKYDCVIFFIAIYYLQTINVLDQRCNVNIYKLFPGYNI